MFLRVTWHFPLFVSRSLSLQNYYAENFDLGYNDMNHRRYYLEPYKF